MDRRNTYIFNQRTSLSFGRARLAIPTAALLYAIFLGLLLFTVFLGESRNSERKDDGQGKNGNNGFHGAFPLRMGANTECVRGDCERMLCCRGRFQSRGDDISLGDEATTPAPLLLVQRRRLVN